MSAERKIRGQTPSQTVGPYFAYGLTPEQYGYPALASIAAADLRTPDVEGERIRIEGRVLDGKGPPVDDAMIEIWQADPPGRYAHPDDTPGNADLRRFRPRRTATGDAKRFVFSHLNTGAAPDPHTQ